MKPTSLALAAPLLVAFAAGCDGIARPIAEGEVGRTDCTHCHGDATREEPAEQDKAAPPQAPGGVRDAGAHLAHLHGGPFRGRIACAECHVVPDVTFHTNGKVELTFGAIARANGVEAAFDPGAATCAVWCHGAKLSGGPATSPAWFDRAPAECGDCHGAPPPNHAPDSEACHLCHEGTVDADRKIIVSGGLHMNGTIDSTGHAPGWSDPGEHGAAAKEDLASCRTCHGDDYGGGSTGASCNACHGGTAWQSDCTFCHGDPGRQTAWASAPPEGTRGETLTTQRAVGAHARHLAGGGVGPAVACAECHAAVDGLGHVDGTPQVVFGDVAKRGGRTPAWNGGTLTCSNTSCHGSAQPVWTGGAAQAACGTCHGVPPVGHSGGACSACHTGYTTTSVNPALHMNGEVDASGGHAPGWGAKEQHGYSVNANGLASCKACHGATLTGGTAGSCNTCHAAFSSGWSLDCTFCHGTPGLRASPPVDTAGLSARANVAVGAHERHATATLSAAVGCATCHPARGDAVTDVAHVDGGDAAEVVLSGVGTGTYTRASATAATCSTYCHGVFPGGRNASVSWVSTTAMTCTSCHSAPPPVPHVQRTDCGACHGGYSSSSVTAATHVNGTVEHVTLGCTTCHGKAGQTATAAAPLNAAPPIDTTGASTGSRVGAHQKHLVPGTYLATGVPCASCHAGVAGYGQGHANGTREVGFTGAPNANLRLGTWTAGAGGAAGSCSATWCHGNFTGGANATVSWTGGAMTCGSCHGAPPAGHPTGACVSCHEGYTATTVNPAVHLDGKIDATGGHAPGWSAKEQHGYAASADGLSGCKTCHGTELLDCTTCHTAQGFAGWRTDCTFCHGTPGVRASPPVDTAGLSARANVSVGAHEKHATTAIATAIGCVACHATRGDVVTDAAHMDGGAAEVALTGVANGTYTRTSDTAATCSTYCHGTFPGGNNQPVSWVSTAALTCTSCHGSPPAAPHVQRTDCATCHAGYSSSGVVAASHVNGVNDHVTLTCTTCHGKVGQSATPAAPLNAAPPTDTTNASTGARVGAHQKHLVGGNYSNPFACTTCHQAVGGYVQKHANGTRDVGFGGAANANLRLGTFNAGAGSCSATWCHGAVISPSGGTAGGTGVTPTWTGTISACTVCHGSGGGAKPNTGKHSDHSGSWCGECHGTGYTTTAVSKALHVNGTKDLSLPITWTAATRRCNGTCHGKDHQSFSW